MAKIELNDTNSGYNRSAINLNFQRIKDFLNDRVLMRNNVAGEPNTVENDIDFNGKKLYNLPSPSSATEPARLQDLADAIANGAVLASSTKDGLISSTDFVKLQNIDDNATQNQTDIYLLDRTNHTGSQAISTVTGLQTALDSKQETLISGTSIKTVNGSSVLGSGNIVVSGGSGTVTSVAASVPSFLSVSGSPITTSGTLAVTYSGTALPVANGGTGVTTSTGSGANVLGTSPTLTTPVINGFTGDTSVINIGSGQFVKDTAGNVSVNKASVRSGYRADIYEATGNGLNIQSGDIGSDIVLSLGSAGTADKVTVNAAGDLLVNAGGLGYGTGAGGTVTQPTSKGTSITLNKPCGQITMSGSALGAGARVEFGLNNTSLAATDQFIVETNDTNGYLYKVRAYYWTSGTAYIECTNISGGSRSDALVLRFAILKGAAA